MLIKYKPVEELKVADALPCLYLRRSHGVEGLNPDWPMLIMRNKNKEFPEGTKKIAQSMVIKNKHLFANVHGVLHRKMTDGTSVSYVPVSQRVDTVLRYHWDLGHTRAHNLFEFLKLKYWWPSLYRDVFELVEQCEICKKFTKTKSLPKLVLPITVHKPFKVWALDIVGPMPGKSNNNKKYIITAVE